MNYCSQCGLTLIEKLDNEGSEIPYCSECQQYYYPVFNSAVSLIIFNQEKTHVMLARHVGVKDYVLIAGYINKGENANEAVIRELKEETNLNVLTYEYNDNRYFERTNTLIHNFIVTVDDAPLQLNEELSDVQWVKTEESLEFIRPGSLAKEFLNIALNKN